MTLTPFGVQGNTNTMVQLKLNGVTQFSHIKPGTSFRCLVSSRLPLSALTPLLLPISQKNTRAAAAGSGSWVTRLPSQTSSELAVSKGAKRKTCEQQCGARQNDSAPRTSRRVNRHRNWAKNKNKNDRPLMQRVHVFPLTLVRACVCVSTKIRAREMQGRTRRTWKIRTLHSKDQQSSKSPAPFRPFMCFMSSLLLIS